MFESYKIHKHQGKQYIPDVTGVTLPPQTFLGKPEIGTQPCRDGCHACEEACPTEAIKLNPLTLDFGKCLVCSECVRQCPEDKIRFTQDYRTATNDRSRLIIREGDNRPVELSPSLIRKEIVKYFGNSLKLRQVSAGGDGSCELELAATLNVNFDMGRFGIEFISSPRHADGLVITGPITENMAGPLETAYEAMPSPKLIILAGTDAISGGIFHASPAINRSFLSKYKVDLYIPGNPPHPLTFINGVLDLIKKRNDNTGEISNG